MCNHLVEIMSRTKSNKSKNQTWWRKVAKIYKEAKLFSEFLRRANIHGYCHILAKDGTFADRVLWAFVSIFVICVTSWSVITIYIDFANTPTATNRLPDRVPISTVPFPSLAICSGNRFNKETLWRFAEKIYDFQHNSSATQPWNSIEKVFDAVKLIGKFYALSYTTEEYYVMDKLHSILIEMYEGPYPINNLIRELAINCTELLVRCVLLNEQVDCNKIFRLRTAYIGVCCMFNYNREYLGPNELTLEKERNKTANAPIYVAGSGMRNGLSVVVNDEYSKYTFKLYSSVSTKIAVFESPNFPDVMSAAVSEGHMISGREVQILIYPILVTGSPGMRKFSPKVRKCFFDNEADLVLKRFYSLSECLITCRIQDIYDFCGCVPPHMTNILNASYCLLTDISCLGRWMDKWMAYEPLNLIDTDADKFLQCPQCMSRCEYIKYKTESSYFDIGAPANGKYYDYGLLKNLSGSDLSVLHIFFAQNYAVKMHQSVIYDWLEMLALLGGICGFIFGVSFLSIFELIYFVSGKFFAIWHNTLWNEEDGNIRSIYWNEVSDVKRKFNQKNSLDANIY